MVLAPTPAPAMSLACLLPVENLSQGISLIREVRNAETEENSQRRLNDNNVVIKHRQGPLTAFSRAVDNTLSHILTSGGEANYMTTRRHPGHELPQF